MILFDHMADTLAFYPTRGSVTAKSLLNGTVRLIFGATDANVICLFRKQLIYSGR